jgi:hypothetical protein
MGSARMIRPAASIRRGTVRSLMASRHPRVRVDRCYPGPTPGAATGDPRLVYEMIDRPLFQLI